MPSPNASAKCCNWWPKERAAKRSLTCSRLVQPLLKHTELICCRSSALRIRLRSLDTRRDAGSCTDAYAPSRLHKYGKDPIAQTGGPLSIFELIKARLPERSRSVRTRLRELAE